MKRGKSEEEQLTFWLEEAPANPSAMPEGARALTTQEVNSCFRTLESLGVLDLDGWFGKTCPESLAVEEDGTLVPLSGAWQNWGMVSPTESWTLSGAEWTGSQKPSRNDGDVCSLSDVLETLNVPPKYFLSPKACEGILRRAKRRSKEIPSLLIEALEQEAKRK